MKLVFVTIKNSEKDKGKDMRHNDTGNAWYEEKYDNRQNGTGNAWYHRPLRLNWEFTVLLSYLNASKRENLIPITEFPNLLKPYNKNKVLRYLKYLLVAVMLIVIQIGNGE